MNIRCPQCEHTRNISESRIPPTAELATCPKCKHRFRFRTLELSGLAADQQTGALSAQPTGTPMRKGEALPPPGPAVQRPQSAFREVAEQNDIWDAVDALHQRWQNQMDQHVTEVVTPRAAPVAQGKTPVDNEGRQKRAAMEKARSLLEERVPPPNPKDPPRFQQDAPARQVRRAGEAADERRHPGSRGASQEESPFFPYGNGAPPPEFQVEQAMEMLRASPEERPLRDLGALREHPEPSPRQTFEEEPAFGATDEASYGQNGPSFSLAWEGTDKRGWRKGLTDIVQGAMLRTPAFFASLSPAGSFAPPSLFFLITGYITLLGVVIWSQAMALFLPGLAPVLEQRGSLPILFLAAPLALGLMLILASACLRALAWLFAPDRGNFLLIYKITAYSTAPFVLSLVPFVGPVIGAGWFVLCLTAGCRSALRFSWSLAFLAALPPAALILAGFGWYVI